MGYRSVHNAKQEDKVVSPSTANTENRKFNSEINTRGHMKIKEIRVELSLHAKKCQI